MSDARYAQSVVGQQPQQYQQNNQMRQSAQMGDNTRKSRIVGEIKLDRFHEKGYHKRFLGEDLDVVCFLLACEVERLYEDRHVWKSKYDELHNQGLDRGHYDAHIAELTERLNQYETQNEALMARNDDLQSELDNWRNVANERGQQVANLGHENDQLKRQVRDLEEQLRNLQQKCDQQNQYIQDLIPQLKKQEEDLRDQAEENAKHKGRIQHLDQHLNNRDAEVNALKKQLDEKNKQLKDLFDNYTKLEIQMVHYKELEDKLRDFENRIAMLTTECERLNNLLNQKSQECDEWRNKAQNGDNQNADLNRKVEILTRENNDLKNFIATKQQEADQLRNDYNNLLSQIRQLEGILAERDSKIAMLTQEIERLNNILKEKMNENDRLARENGQILNELQQWKAKESYIISLENKNNDLTQLLQNRDAEIQNKNQELDEKKQNIYRIEAENQQLQDRVINLENRAAMLASEAERQNQLLGQKEQEINGLRQQIQEMQNVTSDRDRQIAILKQKISELEEALRRNSEEINSWKKRAMDLQTTIEQYKTMELELAALNAELERLQRENADLTNMNQQLQQHYLARNELEEKVGAMSIQTVLLFAEIESLRLRVKDKEREVDEVRRSSLQPIKQSVNQRLSNMQNSQQLNNFNALNNRH